VVLLTGKVTHTRGLGRIIRDASGRVTALVEEKELRPEQRSIAEINFGAYVFDRFFLESALGELSLHATGEYYLPDVIGRAVERELDVSVVSVPNPDEQMGINDPDQLARAERYLARRAS
jgi:bifunctional UDP-N-acetylglucosamine pyrophosphorylase/glucosamine-1-phosphate N-acetyltransferase